MTQALDSPSASPGANGTRRPLRHAGYGVVLVAIILAICTMAAAEASWGHFLATCILAVALLTITTQTLRAATANPVKSLRTE